MTMRTTDFHISPQIFLDLVNAAASAPSADNNQPWKFRLKDGGIEVYLDLARRLPSDVDGMFDLLSIGAVIENLSLRLAGLGKQASTTIYAPQDLDNEKSNESLRLIAHVFALDRLPDAFDASLSKFIPLRHTNRQKFSRASISDSHLANMMSSNLRTNAVQLNWLKSRSGLSQFASLVQLSDSLRFRYEEFHTELYRQLRLSKAHSELAQDGLDYRTLGLPPGGRLVLKAIRNWKTMSLLNRFGLASLLALPGAQLIRCCGAIGLIYLKDQSFESMIEGGRVMQRIWLHATQLGYSIHPIGSPSVFLADTELPEELNSARRRIRLQAEKALPEKELRLQIAFRIGKTIRPTKIRSLRIPANNLLID